MKQKLLLRLAALLAMLTVAVTANAQVWLGSQLGSPAHQGFVVTNTDGTLSIEAGGNDIWNASDSGFFYYTWAQGNWDAKVYLTSLVNSSAYGGNGWAKTEIMIRCADPTRGIQGNDAFIATMSAPGQGNGTGTQYRPARSAAAADTGTTYNATKPPQWLRLTRTNQVFTVLSSADGTTWTTHQTIDVSATANGFGVAWPDLVAVGIAVTAHDDGNNNANFTTATIEKPVISSSGPSWTTPTSAGTSKDVANCSTFVGSEASFTFNATNNAAPVSFPMLYQWYRNGALVPGVTGTGFTWLAAAADAGTTVYCVGWPQGYPSITVTSSIGTLAVSSSTVVYNNALKLEIMAGATRAGAEIGNSGPGDTGNLSVPGKLRWLSSFEDGGGWGDNTSRRISGYFIPWTSGTYTFYVAADDDTDVFLSTDSDPTHKNLICQELAWSGFNNWTTNSDATTNNWDPAASNQKCSDTWTNAAGEAANPNGILLTAGTRCYIEVVEHNGGGGDNCSVTAKLFSDPAPTNGAPSTLTTSSNDIAAISWQVTTISFTGTGAIQPTNTSVSEGQSATFYGRAVTDSEFQPNYQWLRYGTNIPGATRSSYTINPTTANMSGATFSLVATVPGLAPITSQVGTLTIQTAVFEPGFVLEEKWNVNNLTGLVNDSLGTPNYVAAIPALEASINGATGDNYSRRLSGFLIPATTGAYDFYTSSDDNSIIFLSTDSDPAHKREIARETGWSNPFFWDTTGDGAANNQNGNLALKSSITWTNATSADLPPYASGINLVAGTKYFVEVDHQDGTGGDNVTTAMVPHGVAPERGKDYAPSGNLIGINAPKANWVQFTVQPTNPVPVAPGPSSTASFYAFGITDSKIAVGSTSANGPNNTEVANQFVFFQWYRGNAAIAGATTSQLTITALTPSDNGATFRCQMRALGYGQAPNTRFWSNSLTATLSVTNDPTVPTITYAGYYSANEGSSAVTPWVSLSFNVPIDPSVVTNPANYSVTGATVDAVVVSADYRHVQLRLSQLPTGTPTVTFTGGRSWSGVAMANGTAQAHALPSTFTFQDLGNYDQNTGTYDPAWPGRLYIDGTNTYTIAAQGSDIWAAADGFSFLYEQKTGDFDVVMRQTAYSLSDRWAKCGLMVRETIDPAAQGAGGQSRNWNVVNDPPNLPCTFDGNGANAVECNWRTNLNSNSSGWGNGASMAPGYPNAWVRIKRVGSVLTAYGGTNGITWTELAGMDVNTNTATTALPNTLYVGVCTTGHHNDALTATTLPSYNYVTVDHYNSAYVQPPPQQVMTAQVINGKVVISWNPAGGTLLSSPDLVNWSPISGATSPYTNSAAAAKLFYRVSTP